MKKIGLLSDTHAYWDNKFSFYFSNCDEIWHAGDIGSKQVLNQLKFLKNVRAVCGNIDENFFQIICPKILRFKIENINVLLTHIGGYPGKYNFKIRDELYKNPPNLFVCGHSHILKIEYDKSLRMLYVNPGYSGKCNLYQIRTLLKFVISGDQIKNMKIIELK